MVSKGDIRLCRFTFSGAFKILTDHTSYVLYQLQLQPRGNTAHNELTQVLYLCCDLLLQVESFSPFPSLECRFPRQMSRSATETHITTAYLNDNTGQRSVQTEKKHLYMDASSTPVVVSGFIFFLVGSLTCIKPVLPNQQGLKS